jgi:hypothetical protein
VAFDINHIMKNELVEFNNLSQNNAYDLMLISLFLILDGIPIDICF